MQLTVARSWMDTSTGSKVTISDQAADLECMPSAGGGAHGVLQEVAAAAVCCVLEINAS